VWKLIIQGQLGSNFKQVIGPNCVSNNIIGDGINMANHGEGACQESLLAMLMPYPPFGFWLFKLFPTLSNEYSSSALE